MVRTYIISWLYNTVSLYFSYLLCLSICMTAKWGEILSSGMILRKRNTAVRESSIFQVILMKLSHSALTFFFPSFYLTNFLNHIVSSFITSERTIRRIGKVFDQLVLFTVWKLPIVRPERNLCRWSVTVLRSFTKNGLHADFAAHFSLTNKRASPVTKRSSREILLQQKNETHMERRPIFLILKISFEPIFRILKISFKPIFLILKTIPLNRLSWFWKFLLHRFS